MIVKIKTDPAYGKPEVQICTAAVTPEVEKMAKRKSSKKKKQQKIQTKGKTTKMEHTKTTQAEGEQA